MEHDPWLARSAFLIWLASVLAAAGIAHWLLPIDWQGGILALGLLCMLYTLVAFALARRRASMSALIPLAWAGAFGMWMPILQDYAVEHASAPLIARGLSPDTAADFATAAGLLAGGVLTGAALFIGTMSAAVMLHVSIVTALVAGAALSRGEAAESSLVAIIAWHAGVSGSLGYWSVRVGRAAREGVCPKCGETLRGIGRNACPECNAGLVFTPPPRPREEMPQPPRRAA
ncbi:MAG: hypothetical protein AAFX79_00510 [Planctomycetota bacterium]